MKKVLFAIAICFITMAALSSCSSHDNTPEGVAKAAVECLKAKDYKGYMDLTSATKEQKEAMTAMLQKVGQQTDEKGGVESYEIVDQEIDEEKGTATGCCRPTNSPSSFTAVLPRPSAQPSQLSSLDHQHNALSEFVYALGIIALLQ